MLESANVTLNLGDFDRLREESKWYRELAGRISNCCKVDWEKYEKTEKEEDVKVVIDKEKLLKVVLEYSCWGTDDEIESSTVTVELI